MNSREVNELVMSYLLESGYSHTCFSLAHESSTAVPSAAGSSSLANPPIPPGHLIRILHKGLLYLEAEARYRGDPPTPQPRIVGYPISDALPVPPVPKHRPVPPPPPPLAAPAAAPPPAPPSTKPDKPASAPAPPTKDVKGKGKAREKETSPSALSTASSSSTKRKGSERSDREDGRPANGTKRPKTAEGSGIERKKAVAAAALAEKEKEKGKKKATEKGSEDGDGMEVEDERRKDKGASGKVKTKATSPTVRRSTSPAVSRKPKNGSTMAPPDKAPSKADKDDATPKASTLSTKATSASSQASSHPSRPSTPASSVAPPPSKPSEPTKPSSKPATTPSATPTEPKPKANGSSTAPAPSAARQQQIAKIKAEDGEPGAPPPPIDMSTVKQLTPTSTPVTRLLGHVNTKVQACAWNDKVPALLATGAADSSCRIWDVPDRPSATSGEGAVLDESVVCKHTSAQKRTDVSAVAWDPSGSLLATGSDDGVARIWTPVGDLHLVLSMHQRPILTLSWNPMGTMLLTGSSDGLVCLWELSNGKVKQQWTTHADGILSVDWNDDNTFASASQDNTIHLFNINRATPVHRLKGHRDEVNKVVFAPCGTLVATCSDDATVRVWSLRNIPALPLGGKVQARDEDRLIDDEEVGGCFVLQGHTEDVHSVAWAPVKAAGGGPRLLATASFDGTSKLWNADDGSLVFTFARHTDYVYSVAFSPGDGALLATGSNDGKVCVWDVKERRLVLEYEHSGPVYELAWQAGGRKIAACGEGGEVAVVLGEQGVGGVEVEKVGEDGESGEGVFGSGTGAAAEGDMERARVTARSGREGRIVLQRVMGLRERDGRVLIDE